MKYSYFILSFALLASCGQSDSGTANKEGANTDSSAVINQTQTGHTLTDKSEKFLWWENRKNADDESSPSALAINEELCKNLSDAERAALGYVATFVGSDCDWDGKENSNSGNLKCKVLSALNLGYQCSEQHLGFLRKWFSNDSKALQELENCPITPNTSSQVNTFLTVNLKVKGKEIAVEFEASGLNMNAGQSWTWTETDYFEVEGDHIKLTKKDQSEIKIDK